MDSMNTRLRVISVTRIFNEDDIVEAFVRHNICHLGHMIFLDNGSSDRTLDILKALKDEGVSLSVFQGHAYIFDELAANSWMYQIARQLHQPDWVVFLDADEFIDVTAGETLAQHLSGEILAVPLIHYGQTKLDDADELIVPRRLRWRQISPTNVHKIFICGRLDGEVTIDAGNHGAYQNGRNMDARASAAIALAHYPRRNGWQNLQKITIGWLKVLAAGAPALGAGRSSHYRSPFETLRDTPAQLLGNPEYLDKELDIAACEEVPLQYRGGALLYTRATDPAFKAFQTSLRYCEQLALQHGQLLDSAPAARQIVDAFNAQRRFLF